ncbi:MAG TPA: TPM domain-containing protein [Thermoanaerobaculia bacterium]|nr:TPM domain-containing protein [Thermoanaerobaculia bacterium]
MRNESVLSRDDIARLEAKIAAAEQATTAQLRVALVGPSWLGIRRKARKLFERHGMAATTERNAVLLVADLRSHEVVVYGDEGVSSRVGQEFWDQVRDAMVEDFKAGRPAQAFSTGVRLLGEKLSELFPSNGSPTDGLSNAVIID